jgi:hypothetical protein
MIRSRQVGPEGSSLHQSREKEEGGEIMFGGGTKGLHNMRLITKLLVAFFFMAAMIAGAGGIGLFSMKKIELLARSDVSSPLIKATGELIDQMERGHIATLELLSAKEKQEIEKGIKAIEGLDDKFHEKRGQLSQVVKMGNIQMDVQGLTQTYEKFLKEAREMIAAHQTKVAKEAATGQKLMDFEKRRQELDVLLVNLSNRSEAAINEKEDQGKTLAQSGKASVSDMDNLLSELFSQDYPFVQGALKLQRYLMQLLEISRAYVIEKDAKNLAATQERFERAAKEAESRLKRVASRARSAEDKQLMQELDKGFGSLKESVLSKAGLFAIHRDYLKAAANENRLQGVLQLTTRDFRSALDQSYEAASQFSEKARRVTSDGIRGAQGNIGLIVVIGIAVGVVGGWLIARSITRPIYRVAKSLKEGAERVASASEQVSSSSYSLSEGASEQAASLEETASSLEELASMTQKNAENANMANSLVKKSNEIIRKGRDSMTELTQSMGEISGATEETSKIIKTIDEIAFQTNLLALNAAVEAARAGEAGAGFAVVAGEVRNLALRAAEAAKSTARLIESTLSKVKRGGELVGKTGEAFSEVVSSSARVSQLVNEITAACTEQAQGIEQVTKAMSQMDKVTQQTAGNAEESAAVSQDMNSQADQMKGVVDTLTSLVAGRA